MEGRLRILLLTRRAARALAPALLACLLPGCAVLGGGAAEPVALEADEGPVVDARVDRREISRARIDTEDFELGVYGGFVSIEDFGTNPVYGARLAYHVSESFFAEAFYGEAEAGKTSFEALSGAASLLTEDERRFRFYDLMLGYNLLPGEVFLGRGRAFDSNLYVVAGAGNTEFAGEDRFTASLGTGYRVMLLDGLSVHFTVRDRIFTSELLGEQKNTHNIEFSLGANWFF